MVKQFACLLVFLAAGCAGSPPLEQIGGELVVWGTLKNRSFEVLDEWGLNGCVTAVFRVTRVETGSPPSRTLKIRYIAHSSLEEGVEMRFRLRKSEKTGEYLVCAEGGRGFICS